FRRSQNPDFLWERLGNVLGTFWERGVDHARTSLGQKLVVLSGHVPFRLQHDADDALVLFMYGAPYLPVFTAILAGDKPPALLPFLFHPCWVKLQLFSHRLVESLRPDAYCRTVFRKEPVIVHRSPVLEVTFFLVDPIIESLICPFGV